MVIEPRGLGVPVVPILLLTAVGCRVVGPEDGGRRSGGVGVDELTANASLTFPVVELRRSGRRVIACDDCLGSPLGEATDQRVHFVGKCAGFDDSNRRTERQSDHCHDEGIEFVGAESNRARVGFGVDGCVVDP